MIIEKIKVKNGPEVNLGKFTVLIGPNNVGKSQTLKDIHTKFINQDGFETVLIESITFDKDPGLDFFLSGLDIKPDGRNVGLENASGITSKLNSSDSVGFYRRNLEQQYQEKGIPSLFGNIAKFLVSYLDAESRLNVAKTASSANLHKVSPQNLLQALYGADVSVENELRSAFKYVFNKDIKLDYSGLTELTFRVSEGFEQVPQDPKFAAHYFRNIPILDEQGDGYRSFVGVVLSLLLSHDRIVLLDEPEAFLHPAQARQLGFWLAKHIEKVPGQVIISTHNSNFISGILSANHPVDIYRLNRVGNITTFNSIPSQATESLSKSPILSSQRVLEALFHRGVVVCEADSDRIFYSSVSNISSSTQEVLFIHAHNKQTVHQVLTLLKSANIPSCCILDIDILNSKSDLNDVLCSLGAASLTKEQENLLSELAKNIEAGDEAIALKELTSSIEEFLHQLNKDEHDFSGARGAINRIRKDTSKWSSIKSSGTSILEGELKIEIESFLAQLANLGLFVVPVGELEGWIDLGDVKKNKWIVPALESLSENGAPKELEDFVASVVSRVNVL
ncbi:ATP-dependent nuclease [Aeromonas dhakensis]|uniref:ATP-dependent nuclease n=1 Tax=Aeromonas dhakensis TaxID=196024 RepID=UPI003DA3410D